MEHKTNHLKNRLDYYVKKQIFIFIINLILQYNF